MKVVVFCGGLGVRMGQATSLVPKPMIRVGSRPILWHIMKWYASWGHKDFILCLGYQAECIKDYFLNYNEALANDFVLTAGQVELLGRDTDDWRITFVDTGLNTTLGDRLRAAREHLDDDDVFLVTYGDGLTDAPLDDMIRTLDESGKTGLFMAVRPPVEYHLVDSDDSGLVKAVRPFSDADVWINGGFFVFRPGIFDVIEPGDELVYAPFARLVERGELLAYRHEGFWEAMDTIKDKQKLDALVETGRIPWAR